MRERLISVPERSRVFVIIKKFAQTLGVFFLRKPALQRIAQLGEVAVSALELLELDELLFRHILLILAPLLLVDLHCFEEVLQRRLHDVPNPLRRLGSAVLRQRDEGLSGSK